jgi:hypothetical protein
MCENSSPAPLREEYRLRVFGNLVPRRIFGLKRDEETGGRENYIMRHYINIAVKLILLG